jgi:hypothetical protein
LPGEKRVTGDDRAVIGGLGGWKCRHRSVGENRIGLSIL